LRIAGISTRQKMGDCGGECLGGSVGGFVKNDKVPNLASDHAFALAALLFGNVCEQKKNPWASVVFGPSAVMPALVAGIHVFKACSKERRGWPEQARP
jgi:hypothetical protein